MEKLFNSSEMSSKRFAAQKLLDELVKSNKTITFIEGCSGGKLNTEITIPGSTKAFHMGIVSYSQASKIKFGVSENTIKEYGEYSPQVVISMSQVARKYRNDSLVVSTVGELTSPSPYCHVAYSFGGNNTYTEILNFQPKSKNIIKDELTEIIFSHAYLLVHGNTIDNDNHLNINSNNSFQYSIDDEARSIVTLLKQKKLKISTMESCTGGEIASRLTDIDGASEVFDSAFVTYDENVKRTFGVPFSSMYKGGVYSKQVAFEMAKAAMLRTHTDISIGTTGIMDTIDTRPFHAGIPGLVYIAILVRGQIPIVKSLDLRPKLTTTREQLKKAIVDEVFLSLTEILENQKENENIDCLNNLYVLL